MRIAHRCQRLLKVQDNAGMPSPRPLAFDALPIDFAPALPLAVGFSGGADSTALLLLAQARWPGQVLAVHVNHGLQAAAADFERHAIDVCAQRGIALAVARVASRGASGQSPEDAARIARWRAFEAVASSMPGAENSTTNWHLASDFKGFCATKNVANCTSFSDLALAHHADDQAETLLLALSRGAGLGGMSAMPARRMKGSLVVHRPLLHLRSARLRAWLLAQGQGFIDDPSNTNPQFTRNRIRASVMPAIEAQFGQFCNTAARSVAHLAQAQGLLGELAAIDLVTTGVPPAIGALQGLSPPRQANALRHWLKDHCNTQASSAQLAQLQRQISACTTRAHHIDIKVGSGAVRRAGASLAFCPSRLFNII